MPMLVQVMSFVVAHVSERFKKKVYPGIGAMNVKGQEGCSPSAKRVQASEGLGGRVPLHEVHCERPSGRSEVRT